jgi:hypothetical protein
MNTPTASKQFGKIFSQDMIKKPQRKKSVSLTRRKNTFKLPKPLDNPLDDIEVRDSFKRAFFAKDFIYTHK